MKYLLPFLLLVFSLFACEQEPESAPDKPAGVTAISTPASDFSDPAKDVRYGVSALVQGEYKNSGINRRNALTVRPVKGGYSASTADDAQVHDDKLLKRRIMEFVMNPRKEPYLAEEMNQAHIFLIDEKEGDTTWRADALRVVRLAYTAMWDGQSQKRYGKKYGELSTKLKRTILDKAPPKISLAGPWIIPPPPPPPPAPVIERVPGN